MSTNHRELWAALTAPFRPDELKQKERKTKDGRKLTMHYVDAQHIQERLDRVVGPENWELSLVPWGPDLIATLTITLPDGTQVKKSDVGGRPNMPDPSDAAKGAASHALRRCAVLFGIGRYLYLKDGGRGGPGAPPARPGREPGDDPVEPEHRRGNGNGSGSGHRKERSDWGGPAAAASRAAETPPSDPDAPRSGGALYRWAKGQDEEEGYGVVKHLDSWAGAAGLPRAWKEWDRETVARAYREGLKRIRDIQQSAAYAGN